MIYIYMRERDREREIERAVCDMAGESELEITRSKVWPQVCGGSLTCATYIYIYIDRQIDK